MIRKIEDIKADIKKALECQGAYSDDLVLAIDLLAGAFLARDIALSDISKLKKTTLKEKSREGFSRTVQHPAFNTFNFANEMVRKCLREMRLTSASMLGGTDNDEISDIIDDVNKTEDD